MKRYGNLWKEVVDEDNLFLAAVKAVRGLEDEEVAEYGEADLKEKWQLKQPDRLLCFAFRKLIWSSKRYWR